MTLQTSRALQTSYGVFKAGEIFTVPDAYGEQMLKNISHIVSEYKPPEIVVFDEEPEELVYFQEEKPQEKKVITPEETPEKPKRKRNGTNRKSGANVN